MNAFKFVAWGLGFEACIVGFRLGGLGLRVAGLKIYSRGVFVFRVLGTGFQCHVHPFTWPA